MGRNLKRAAVVAAATVLMVAPSATANAAGDAVNCAVNGGHCESGFIAANAQYHCLKYSVHRSWWGSTSWAVRDWDTLVNVAQGTIGWIGFEPSGTIYGLYGQRYYGYMYNSDTGAWMEITNDCSY